MLETMGEGLMKQKFVQGMVNAVEGASSLVKSGMLTALSEINKVVAKYASPAYDAIRITLQKAGILAPLSKPRPKSSCRGSNLRGMLANSKKPWHGAWSVWKKWPPKKASKP